MSLISSPTVEKSRRQLDNHGLGERFANNAIRFLNSVLWRNEVGGNTADAQTASRFKASFTFAC
jgi:hypothetical protein